MEFGLGFLFYIILGVIVINFLKLIFSLKFEILF